MSYCGRHVQAHQPCDQHGEMDLSEYDFGSCKRLRVAVARYHYVLPHPEATMGQGSGSILRLVRRGEPDG